MFTTGAPETVQAKCALYKTDYTFVAETEERTITVTGARTRFVFNFVNKPILQNIDYYIVAFASGVTQNIGIDVTFAAGSFKRAQSNSSFVYQAFPVIVVMNEFNGSACIYCNFSTAQMTFTGNMTWK